jgi:hypothetical protein
MRRLISVVVAFVVLFVAWAQSFAATYPVALSPAASAALNLGTETYPGDHALGLSPQNESNMPASTASGDVLGGIMYDDVANLLTFDFGYGSAFGFSDLNSDWNGGVHIHGDGTNTAQFPSPNTNAGIIINLGPFHTAAGTRSGRVTGSVTLSATHEGWLLDNQLYVNVHTSNNPGGEIRGQLVPVVPEPGAVCLAVIAGLPLLVSRRWRA